MYCSRCGSKCEQGERFCKSCGEPLKENNTGEFNISLNSSHKITEETLEQAYVGPNYEKIKSGRFSFPAFFFGIYYLIYRKMWVYVLGFILIMIGTNILIQDYASVVGLGIIITLGIGFNKIYMQHVKNKIEKLKIKYSDKSQEELLKICKNKGGTSVGAIIILFFLLFTVLSIAIIVIFATEFGKELSNEFNLENRKNRVDDYRIGELIYEVPSNYKLENYGSVGDKTYRKEVEGSLCRFSMTSRSNSFYKTEEEYFKKTIYTSIGDTVSTIEEIPINNMNWKRITVESDNKITYYYASLFKDKIYSLEYSIYKERDDCRKDYENFITTVRLKDDELITS